MALDHAVHGNRARRPSPATTCPRGRRGRICLPELTRTRLVERARPVAASGEPRFVGTGVRGVVGEGGTCRRLQSSARAPRPWAPRWWGRGRSRTRESRAVARPELRQSSIAGWFSDPAGRRRGGGDDAAAARGRAGEGDRQGAGLACARRRAGGGRGEAARPSAAGAARGARVPAGEQGFAAAGLVRRRSPRPPRTSRSSPSPPAPPGEPKGCVHLHRDLLGHVRHLRRSASCARARTTCSPATPPLAFTFGLGVKRAVPDARRRLHRADRASRRWTPWSTPSSATRSRRCRPPRRCTAAMLRDADLSRVALVARVRVGRRAAAGGRRQARGRTHRRAHH